MAWTIKQTNAAFDAVEVDLHQLIENFVPFMFKDRARQYLDSPQGRALVLDALHKADAAADAAK